MRTGVAGRRLPKGVTPGGTAFEGLFRGAASTVAGGKVVNQDVCAHCDTPLGLVAMVCDGMGKGEYGHQASLLAVQAIGNYLRACPETDDAAEAVREAVRMANRAIFDFGLTISNDEAAGMGATVAGLLLSADFAVAFHLGDCRIYQLHNGFVKYRSRDHSMNAALVEARVMSEDEARMSPDRHLLVQAIGHTYDPEPGVRVLPYRRGDRFMLCTDGVWRAFRQSKLVETAADAPSPESAVSAILKGAREAVSK